MEEMEKKKMEKLYDKERHAAIRYSRGVDATKQVKDSILAQGFFF
jgi:hypothetical protein